MAVSVSVKSHRTSDGITVHLSGPLVSNLNHEVLAACAQDLMACAEKNACLQEGLRISSPCVETVARHQNAAHCLTEGFGVAGRR